MCASPERETKIETPQVQLLLVSVVNGAGDEVFPAAKPELCGLDPLRMAESILLSLTGSGGVIVLSW